MVKSDTLSTPFDPLWKYVLDESDEESVEQQQQQRQSGNDTSRRKRVRFSLPKRQPARQDAGEEPSNGGSFFDFLSFEQRDPSSANEEEKKKNSMPPILEKMFKEKEERREGDGSTASWSFLDSSHDSEVPAGKKNNNNNNNSSSKGGWGKQQKSSNNKKSGSSRSLIKSSAVASDDEGPKQRMSVRPILRRKNSKTEKKEAPPAEDGAAALYDNAWRNFVISSPSTEEQTKQEAAPRGRQTNRNSSDVDIRDSPTRSLNKSSNNTGGKSESNETKQRNANTTRSASANTMRSASANTTRSASANTMLSASANTTRSASQGQGFKQDRYEAPTATDWDDGGHPRITPPWSALFGIPELAENEDSSDDGGSIGLNSFSTAGSSTVQTEDNDDRYCKKFLRDDDSTDSNLYAPGQVVTLHGTPSVDQRRIQGFGKSDLGRTRCDPLGGSQRSKGEKRNLRLICRKKPVKELEFPGAKLVGDEELDSTNIVTANGNVERDIIGQELFSNDELVGKQGPQTFYTYEYETGGHMEVRYDHFSSNPRDVISLREFSSVPALKRSPNDVVVMVEVSLNPTEPDNVRRANPVCVSTGFHHLGNRLYD